MAVDKKQRLVPGAMYIPPTPAVVGAVSSGTSSISPSASSALSKSPRSASNSITSAATSRALTPNKPLGELLRSIDPRSCFHPAVEELLLDMASDFVTDVVSFSSRLAKHRRSTTLEPTDLQFCLAKNYGISLAGAPIAGATAETAALNPLNSDILVRARPAKNSLHMHRMALKRKTLQRTTAKLKRVATVKASGDGTKKIVHRKNSSVGAPDTK